MALCCVQEQPCHVLVTTAVDRLFAVHQHLSDAIDVRAPEQRSR